MKQVILKSIKRMVIWVFGRFPSPQAFLSRNELIGGAGGWDVTVSWCGVFHWKYRTTDVSLKETSKMNYMQKK